MQGYPCGTFPGFAEKIRIHENGNRLVLDSVQIFDMDSECNHLASEDATQGGLRERVEVANTCVNCRPLWKPSPATASSDLKESSSAFQLFDLFKKPFTSEEISDLVYSCGKFYKINQENVLMNFFSPFLSHLDP